MAIKEMNSIQNFGSCLGVLQARQHQSLALGATAYKAIFDGERVLCGLENGDLSLVCMMKATIVKLESHSKRGRVSALGWVGPDKCVSVHEYDPSRLWDLAQYRESAVLDAGDREEEESDTSVEINADSQAVFGSDQGNLRLWDLRQPRQIAMVHAHGAKVTCICIVNDKCITGSDKGELKVWTLESLQLLATLNGHTECVNCLEVTSNGQCLSSSRDKTVRVWDLHECKEVACYNGHKEEVVRVKEIEGGRCVSCEWLGEARVWNLKDLSDICQYPFEIRSFEVHESALYYGHNSGLTFLNMNTNQVLGAVELEMINFVHYFEGKCACVSLTNVYILEIEEYQKMRELRGHSAKVYGVIPWGSDKAISWSQDKTLRVWDVSTSQELAVLKGHSKDVLCAALIDDGKCISRGSDYCLKIWDLVEMKEIPTEMGIDWTTGSKILITEGKAILWGSYEEVSVWNLVNYTKLGKFTPKKSMISHLILFSNEIVVTGHYDFSMCVWNVSTLSVLATLEGHQNHIIAIVRASGNRCISSSYDKTIRVWDLQKYVHLATLQGHTGEVTALGVVGEQCVSGSEDKTIIVWNLTNYLPEAKFTCTARVTQIEYLNETQFVSGHANGEIRVWDDNKQIATLTEHSNFIKSLTRLNDHQFASIVNEEEVIRIWDVRQLANCLSLFINESLEREISEDKAVPDHYRSRISDFTKGLRVPQPQCSMLFRPYFFNSLHFCAYYHHPKLLTDYLQEGVPLVRGVFGSPLTLALERNAIQCVDAVLEYLIAAASRDDAFDIFETVNDDLLPLLSSGSPKLEDFFSVLLRSPLQVLPSFIAPIVPLPFTKFTLHPYVNELEYFDNSPGVHGANLVKFGMSLVHWNFIAGSRKSIEMLNAAVDCEDKRVLLTDFFKTIIEYKWKTFYPLTLSVTILYGVMLSCLLGTINLGSGICCLVYLVSNSLFALYEVAQMSTMNTAYFTEGWNMMDIVRCTLSISWASFKLAGYSIEKYVTLTVVLLDFIRGFTHFRSFRMTRVFVYMIFTVVTEMYSFLIILAYSVFAFGIFTSVLTEETSLSETWKKAYNMAMGNFDTSSYGPLEWIVFTGATVTNVVVMMNLLISILGEAYEKAQTTMLENDFHMQANIILEYEILMVWRRGADSKAWVATCRSADGAGEQLEWSGKLLELVTSLTAELSQVKTEITGNIASVEGKVQAIGDIKEKVAGLGDIKTKIAGIEEKVAGIDELKTKMAGMEGKLDAVLGLLQARS